MNKQNRSVNQIKNDVLKCFLKKDVWYRKQIINECLKGFALSKDELQNNSPSSALISAKSMIGSVISSMIRDKIISIDNAKEIRLGSKNLISVNINNQEIYIKDLLKVKSKISINEIKENVKTYYKVYQTESKEDDETLDKQCAIILKKLSDQTYINIVNDQCIYNKKNELYPNTEIGNLLNDSLFKEELYPYFIEAFNIKGGEFLENYATELISKLIESEGKIITNKNVCGGSNDNGIDGIITLDNCDKIYIQTKARATSLVTVKEVREFYGAMACDKASLGYFVTNSDYHQLAKEFNEKAEKLIAINGKTLYRLSKKLKYGIIKQNNKFILDKDIFL